MKKVEYFISERSKDRFFWNKIYELLEEKNISIHTVPKDCDISVVLGGPLVNPLPLKGKKYWRLNPMNGKWLSGRLFTNLSCKSITTI